MVVPWLSSVLSSESDSFKTSFHSNSEPFLGGLDGIERVDCAWFLVSENFSEDAICGWIIWFLRHQGLLL